MERTAQAPTFLPDICLCFLSINEASTINSAIFSFSLMALSFVDDFNDDLDLVPDGLPEFLDFAEDLDEGAFYPSCSL